MPETGRKMTRPRIAFAVALLTLFAAAALLGPYVAPYDPLAPMPLDALLASDFAPVQGFVVVMAFFYLVVNLAIDLITALVDPRVAIDA